MCRFNAGITLMVVSGKCMRTQSLFVGALVFGLLSNFSFAGNVKGCQ